MRASSGAAHLDIPIALVHRRSIGYPQNVDPNKFTLITPFSSERDQWMHSKCINIHDYKSPVYELTDDYDGCRALTKNFFILSGSYHKKTQKKKHHAGGKRR